MLKFKKLIIFDCDGVLFDSAGSNMEYLLHCLRAINHPPLSTEELRKATYLSVRQFIDQLDLNEENYRKIVEVSRKTNFTPFLQGMTPLFDFEKILVPLKCKYHLAIASNRSRSLAEVVEHFGLLRYFHYTVCALDSPPKPDPSMLIKACEHFQHSVQECIFLGDAIVDYEAARRAGMSFLWVGADVPQPGIASIEECLRYI